ncbi:hypothetical protein ASC99_20915 [Kitasatospora sp. Root107]|nr:hypothetical protein ASC99_20915 [Kitasatospora sp. Root107]
MGLLLAGPRLRQVLHYDPPAPTAHRHVAELVLLGRPRVAQERGQGVVRRCPGGQSVCLVVLLGWTLVERGDGRAVCGGDVLRAALDGCRVEDGPQDRGGDRVGHPRREAHAPALPDIAVLGCLGRRP